MRRNFSLLPLPCTIPYQECVQFALTLAAFINRSSSEPPGALDEYEQDQLNAAKAAESAAAAASAAISAVVELEPASAATANATAAAAVRAPQQPQQPSAAAAASMNSALSASDAEILRDPTKFADELKSLMSELGASGSGLPAEDAEPSAFGGKLARLVCVESCQPPQDAERRHCKSLQSLHLLFALLFFFSFHYFQRFTFSSDEDAAAVDSRSAESARRRGTRFCRVCRRCRRRRKQCILLVLIFDASCCCRCERSQGIVSVCLCKCECCEAGRVARTVARANDAGRFAERKERRSSGTPRCCLCDSFVL